MCKSEPIRSHKNLADPEKGAAAGSKAADVWHVLDVDSTMDTLKTSMSGLSSSKAKELLEVYGHNQLTEQVKKTLLERIWGQVNNVLVGILAVVAVVSAAKAFTAKSTEDMITNWLEVALIIFVITLNAWIGIMQEGSAEAAADALKSMLSSDAEVIRDGVNTEIPANELVPGDIVVVKTGDRVPADLRMLEVSNLACTEAALTGESLPVEKIIEAIQASKPAEVPLGDRKNMAFSATLVSQGRGLGIVTSTGDHTQIGTINALVNNVEEKKTAVLEQIDNVSKVIACFVVICGLITFFVAYFHVDQEPLDAVAIALVCAVAMIPEGLASIVSLTYAFAVSNMAKLNAIIRKLPAVETLGSVTVICSDKTGTLTKNEMTLTAFVTSSGRFQFNTDSSERVSTNFVRDDNFMAYKSGESNTPLVKSVGTTPVANGQSPDTAYFQSAMSGGVLCSQSKLGVNGGRDGEIGNPTELAIVRAAYFSGVDIDGMRKKAPQVAEVPFSSEYKFMATVHEPVAEVDGAGHDGEYIVHVKGAPDRMIGMCSHQAKAGVLGEDNMEPIDTEYWTKQISILSSYGLRCLALCRATVPKDSVQKGAQLKADFVMDKGQWLTIVGVCAIMDPPRPECVDAIKTAHKAGIRVVMITGDHKDTALAIGEMLGLVTEKFSEAKTGPELDNMDEMQMRHAVMNYNVFARASPQNKIQIVEALQSEDQVCSMTGDGVNDAPALKKADMGVAMGKEGTDVAREASEMILADDNFATIVAAVREGRVVWDNLRKVLFVNTPINNAQGLTVLFGMVFGMKDPLLTPIQVLYCNLICAVTLGFVLAVEPAEDGIMLHKPRKPGKRIIGRYLLLRIIIATLTLVTLTVGSSYLVRGMDYDLEQIRSQASNTLTFSAISVCLSARFSYLSSIHPRLFRGNKYCWYSLAPLIALQMMITYIPGLNSVLFGMGAMDGMQWGIVAGAMVITFLVMELEKTVRSSLKAKGADTDDERYDARFDN